LQGDIDAKTQSFSEDNLDQPNLSSPPNEMNPLSPDNGVAVSYLII